MFTYQTSNGSLSVKAIAHGWVAVRGRLCIKSKSWNVSLTLLWDGPETVGDYAVTNALTGKSIRADADRILDKIDATVRAAHAAWLDAGGEEEVAKQVVADVASRLNRAQRQVQELTQHLNVELRNLYALQASA